MLGSLSENSKNRLDLFLLVEINLFFVCDCAYDGDDDGDDDAVDDDGE